MVLDITTKYVPTNYVFSTPICRGIKPFICMETAIFKSGMPISEAKLLDYLYNTVSSLSLFCLGYAYCY